MHFFKNLMLVVSTATATSMLAVQDEVARQARYKCFLEVVACRGLAATSELAEPIPTTVFPLSPDNGDCCICDENGGFVTMISREILCTNGPWSHAQLFEIYDKADLQAMFDAAMNLCTSPEQRYNILQSYLSPHELESQQSVNEDKIALARFRYATALVRSIKNYIKGVNDNLRVITIKSDVLQPKMYSLKKASSGNSFDQA